MADKIKMATQHEFSKAQSIFMQINLRIEKNVFKFTAIHHAQLTAHNKPRTIHRAQFTVPN
jgi:hypothetical protein